MAKVSKNARVAQRAANAGSGRDHVKVITSVKNPATGKYSYKEVMIHKDKVKEYLEFFTKEKEEDLNEGLQKTKDSFFGKITKAVAGKSTVDVEFLDELEHILIQSDVGLDTTVKIIERLEEKVAADKYINTDELNSILKGIITDLLAENNTRDIEGFDYDRLNHPHIILVVGVNSHISLLSKALRLCWALQIHLEQRR